MGELAYYKAPGWILFVDSLPTTGTQTVLKTQIVAGGADPREQPGIIDVRSAKRRKA
jgi:crotonobetaine/carnitine-CoA ligase